MSEPLQEMYCNFDYITMKNLALTPNLHVILIHLGHGGQIFLFAAAFQVYKDCYQNLNF